MKFRLKFQCHLLLWIVITHHSEALFLQGREAGALTGVEAAPAGTVSLPLSCDFEQGVCGFSSQGALAWKTTNHIYGSALVGIPSDHTSRSGSYAYPHVRDYLLHNGAVGELVSPTFHHAGRVCVQFAAILTRDTPPLQVTVDHGGNTLKVGEASLASGHWQTYNFSFHAQGDFTVHFVAKKNSTTELTGLDDIKILTCDLEKVTPALPITSPTTPNTMPTTQTTTKTNTQTTTEPTTSTSTKPTSSTTTTHTTPTTTKPTTQTTIKPTTPTTTTHITLTITKPTIQTTTTHTTQTTTKPTTQTTTTLITKTTTKPTTQTTTTHTTQTTTKPTTHTTTTLITKTTTKPTTQTTTIHTTQTITKPTTHIPAEAASAPNAATKATITPTTATTTPTVKATTPTILATTPTPAVYTPTIRTTAPSSQTNAPYTSASNPTMSAILAGHFTSSAKSQVTSSTTEVTPSPPSLLDGFWHVVLVMWKEAGTSSPGLGSSATQSPSHELGLLNKRHRLQKISVDLKVDVEELE